MAPTAAITTLTRLGFAARGLLYLVIAYLVLTSGRGEDPSGALDHLSNGGNQWLLILIIIGFVAYGLWRLSDAALNIEYHEDSAKGLRERLGAGGSGIAHLLLAWQALRLLQGSAGGGDGTLNGGSATMLTLAGLVLLGVGAFQLVKAAKASFCDRLDGRVAHHPWVKLAGRAGYAARGLVFLISGYFFLRAGLSGQDGQGGGMDQALSWLDNPWDVVAALGLALFGFFSLIEARYRRIHPVPVERMASEARDTVGF